MVTDTPFTPVTPSPVKLAQQRYLPTRTGRDGAGEPHHIVIIDPTNPMIRSIREVDLLAVEPYARWGGKLAEIGGGVVARIIDGAITGQGRDHAIGVDSPYSVIESVRDVEIAGRIDVDGARESELGVNRQFAVAAEAAHTGSCDGADRRIRGDGANPVIATVGDVEDA